MHGDTCESRKRIYYYYYYFLQTGSISALLVYEIAKAPEIQERLMEEISSVVGEKEHPSWDDLQKMTLVRNCVKEAMRMYIVGGILARTVPNDTQLLGYEVSGGVSFGVFG